MVFISDFKREFYDVVQHQRVLILVSLDVDALCACRILQYLFQCDSILYTIMPVATRQDLKKIWIDFTSSQFRYIILVNCGATIDIVDMLQPTPEKVFFICDSHRPIDVHNIYNQVQVKLLIKEHEVENIPGFDDIFRDDEDEEDFDDDDDFESDEDFSASESEPSGKRRKLDEDALDRRRNRRLWEQNRRKIMFDYNEYTCWGSSSSLLLYELSWKMSKETNDLLWLAIIGVTEQYTMDKIDRDMYIDSISLLQPHVSRLNPKPAEGEVCRTSVSHLKISFSHEIQLSMYRHWSVLESFNNSRYLACRFILWSLKGKKRLHEFLADMGIPLVQCRQKFQCMEARFKDSFKEVISKYSKKYGVNEQELLLPSFQAQFGYKDKYCAADVVRGCSALLHVVDPKDPSMSSNFLKALDSLSRPLAEILLEGIEQAKSQSTALVSQVQSFLDMNQIVCAGPFLYSFVQQGSLESQLFTRPNCLNQLAKFTLEAYCANSRSKKAKQLPMILGTMLKQKDMMVLVGVPPVLDKSMKNCFGKAFEQAAVNSTSTITQSNFETFVVELRLEDKSKFFDNLISLLQD